MGEKFSGKLINETGSALFQENRSLIPPDDRQFGDRAAGGRDGGILFSGSDGFQDFRPQNCQI